MFERWTMVSKRWKSAAFAWCQHVLLFKVVCLPKVILERFSTSFQKESKNTKRTAGPETFYVIGEHEPTNRTFGQKTIMLIFGENVHQTFKVVFVSEDLFQLCRVWTLDNADWIVLLNDRSISPVLLSKSMGTQSIQHWKYGFWLERIRWKIDVQDTYQRDYVWCQRKMSIFMNRN